MGRSSRVLATSALCLCLIGAGCSGRPGTTAASTTAATSAPGGTAGGGTATTAPVTTAPITKAAAAAAERYFSAFATRDPARMQGMLDAAAPGSPAETYARFQIPYTQVLHSAGENIPVLTARRGPGGAELVCANPRPCDVFGNETADPAGRLTDFWGDGQDVAPRVVRGGASATRDGVTATLVGAYRAVQGGALGVVVDVTNTTGDDVTVRPSDMTYESAHFRAARPIRGWGPQSIPAGTTSRVAASIIGGVLPGTLSVDGTRGGTPFSVRLPVQQ